MVWSKKLKVPTGRSVKYVVHFSKVAVSKAFSSRSLTHQTADEANSSNDVPVPPSISVEAASPPLTLPAGQQEHEVADNTLNENLLQFNGTEWKVIDGVVEDWRCMPKFGAHIFWGNDVDEARRTPLDYWMMSFQSQMLADISIWTYLKDV